MRNLKSLLSTILILFLIGLSLGFTRSVLAGSVCIPIYGGGEKCTKTFNKSFVIKKEVRRVGEINFHESIDNVRDNEILEFRITVKNTGEVEVSKLVIADYLPPELASLQDQLKWDVINLKPQEEKVLYLKATPGNLDKLSSGEKRCVINTVEAKYQDKLEASDTTTICLKKGEVRAIKVLPKTALFFDPLLLSSLGLIGAGFYLRKKSHF